MSTVRPVGPARHGGCFLAGVGVLLASCCAAALFAAEPSGAQAIYRYVNRAGRAVYVNGLERVPVAQRARARAVDLSRISLNESLGNELQRAASKHAEGLLRSPYCTEARTGAARGFWGTLWHEQGHLVLIGGVALLLLVVSPWLVRLMGGSQWVKLLAVALPALAFLALVSSSAVRATRTLRELRGAAEACRPERVAPPGMGSDPAARAQQMHRIFELEQRVGAAGGPRGAALDAILSGSP